MAATDALDQFAEILVHRDNRAVVSYSELKNRRIRQPEVDVAHKGRAVAALADAVLKAQAEADVDE